jgi:raffinose/stachyose/melibiose transport system substrate-binding protein
MLLNGCAKKEDTGGKTVVTVWTEYSAAPQKTVFDQIVADFNKANPNIVVRHTGFENTPYETTLKTAFSGGNPPDIVEVNGGTNAFQYARAELLTDLTDFIEPLRPVITPGMESSFEYRGKAYGIPWQLSIGNMLWYNPAMLKDKGISLSQLETWDGFLAASETFKKAGIAPIAFGNREGWPGNHLYTHFTRRLLSTKEYEAIALQSIDPETKSPISWADPEAVRGWELYLDLLNKGYFTAGYLADDTPTAANQFLTGQAPFYFMGSWFMGSVLLSGGDTPIDVTMFPSIPGGKGNNSELVTNTLVFTLTKASKQPEAAKRFLKYLTTEPVQRKWAEGVQGLVPYSYDTKDWQINDSIRKVEAFYKKASSAAPFLDMLEEQKCNVPGIWDASVGILTRQITPLEAGQMHEKCVVHLRKSNDWPPSRPDGTSATEGAK